MLLSRGSFVKAAGSSVIVLASGLNVHEAVAALPTSVTPDQLDDGGADAITTDKTTGTGQVNHTVHTKGPVTATYLVDGYKNIGGTTYNGYPWKGQTQVLIDEQGNWEFSGAFPGNGLLGAWNIATGVALTSEGLGTAFAWTAQGMINKYRDPGPGVTLVDWSFKNIGHSDLIANLWKYAVKGHKFVGTSHWSHIPNASQPQLNLPYVPASTLLADVKSTLGSKFGAIAAFF